MQITAMATLSALVGSLPLAAAECYGSGNMNPPNHAGTLAALLVACGDMERYGAIPKGANVWFHSRIDDFHGGMRCLNFGLDNVGGGFQRIDYNTAAEGLLREWVDCDHGGKTEYKDGSLKGWRFM
ncbi:hypothetical protein PG996_007925 [Apiospora saccharicola]|uniref:Secreted protein n=1 Tax=Apiospora saccharicola TaxID=335842 RepID=A0ABR1UZP1_9PEZI